MYHCENVTFSYDGKAPILKNVGMDVKRGEITVLIGPSGSGKSTLLKNLSLILLPTSGTIVVDNRKYEFPLGEEEKIIPPWPKVSVCFQQQFLWPHLTLKENITLPAHNVKHEDGPFSYEGLVELFEMKDFINRYPNEASPGQRQRVVLARALMLNPSYLFLDEITTFLDVEQVSKILSCLVQMRERGIGIFLITHLLGFAHDAADHILFFDNGEIVEDGTNVILENPKTERLSRFLSVIKAAR